MKFLLKEAILQNKQVGKGQGSIGENQEFEQVRREAGTVVELTEAEAAALPQGTVEPAKASAPEPKAEGDGGGNGKGKGAGKGEGKE